MAKNLVIVESPAKAKTIAGFLGKDFLVKSSFGHVVDLAKNQLSVDVENGFKPQYQISPDKKKIVAELKKLAKEAETVWLASDEDREGEAISWHLYNALGLKEEQAKRIVFHEITRQAITDAIKTPRSINKHLVDAQQARRVLDRLVGYELSPLLWKKVKPALSAGRVQSVAVRLIVEREEEIKAFQAVSSFRVQAVFLLDNGTELKAELSKRFTSEEEAKSFLESCLSADFKVLDVEKKPGTKSPAPPFTTSTLQQEASRKLGFSVANTMRIAQQLYENGKITYMRTDSVNLSNLAINAAKKEITTQYGDEYVKVRKYTTKTKRAQEAHEAIRPTYLNQNTIEGSPEQKKLYELIWKRTIASQMSSAKIEKTTVKISNSSNEDLFQAVGEVVKFDGFLKVYMEGTDDDIAEEKAILPAVTKGEALQMKSMEATQRFSKHPPRYTEASLVKKMEELGIGRPSTYAPTISTIQKREYVEKGDREGVKRNYVVFIASDNRVTRAVKTEITGYERAKLFPTDIGILVNKFLLTYFKNIIDYNFTAMVEEEFDSIASGNKVWNGMISSFYGPFHDKIENTEEHTKKFSGEKLLGVDPQTGKNVFVKIGRYGPIAQLGDTESEEKPRFAGLKNGQSIEDISLEEALELFRFPILVGNYEDADVTVAIGRFGPYVKHQNKFYSIPKGEEPTTVHIERAIELIDAKRESLKNMVIREFKEEPELRILKGRYGPYINYKKQNFKIPKGIDAETLDLKQSLEIVKDPKNASKGRRKKK